MKLLIDAGNTRVKWAISEARVGTTLESSVIESGVVDSDWSELVDYVGKVESVWLSCVASESVRDLILSQVEDLFGLEPQVATVSAGAPGMVNNYQDLGKLGVDRWVAALGARALVNDGDLIVIDAGTAVTIDLVSAENRFEGGVILPGLAAMQDALLGRTAGIQSQPSTVESVIGTNTHDCVNSGAQFGLLGAIERVVAEIVDVVQARQSHRGFVGKVPRLLIMGGDADRIVEGSALDLEIQSHMIFYGLMLISKL
ncbi:MAG: type III pantothenate kinase [Arenicella sp.]|nr:type III pantothenate kinase [Arenicella sp.]